MTSNQSYSRFLSILAFLVYTNTLSYADTLIIKDGDTISLKSRNIRLFGIDAPELKQQCYDFNGKAWNCGLVAKLFLYELTKGEDITCVMQSIDLYKREVAICYLNEGLD